MPLAMEMSDMDFFDMLLPEVDFFMQRHKDPVLMDDEGVMNTSKS